MTDLIVRAMHHRPDVQIHDGSVVLETLHDVETSPGAELVTAKVQLGDIPVQFEEISHCLARLAAKSVGGEIENFYQFIQRYRLQQIMLPGYKAANKILSTMLCLRHPL